MSNVIYIPISENQYGLWLLQTINPTMIAYNTAATFRLSAELNVTALQRALNWVVDRHPLLRTTFAVQDERPVQCIHPELPPQFEVINVTQRSEEALQSLVQAMYERPFDLSVGPLVRVTVFQYTSNEHIILFNSHHILLDFGSQAKVVQEILEAYLCEQQTLDYPPTEQEKMQEVATNADFVAWQQDFLASDQGKNYQAYWQEQLYSPLPILNLPTDHPYPRQQTYNGACLPLCLPADLSQRILALAKQQKVTPFVLLLTAYTLLIARYSRQEDLIVGVATSARLRAPQRFRQMLGDLVNFLPIRLAIGAHDSFCQILHHTQKAFITGLLHQNYPLTRIVSDALAERDPSRSPLFEVLFNMPVLDTNETFVPLMVGAPGNRTMTVMFNGLQLTPYPLQQQAGSVPLYLELWLQGAQLVGHFKYNTDLFEAATIARMVGHLEVLLTSIVDHPEQPVSQHPLLTAAEYHQLVYEWNNAEWNNTAGDFGAVSHMQALFEQQVARTPDAVAVVCGQEQLTYTELNEQANRMAHVLIEQGVGPEVLVVLYAERSPLFLVAILAIFKAGGAYLPLDPHAPAARIAQILSQSKAPLLLGCEFADRMAEALAAVAAPDRPHLLYLTDLQPQGQITSNPALHSDPSTLAYVIYTSGSTGLPKGAMVEQRGMVNHLFAKIYDLDLDATDRIAQTASQAFDISVWQFLAALVVGGTTYIYPNEIALDPERLLQQVRSDQITIWETVPSLMRALVDTLLPNRQNLQDKALPALRWLIPTGEALPPALANQWLALYPQIPLLNAYGPTECSDDVTHYPIYQPLPPDVVNTPIGRPVLNMRACILDRNMQPTPIGIPGELWIGGVGVGRGYLYDAERTANAFVRDPFCADPDARLYKTGDQARWRPDGQIEYLGRIDFQVKIRGFRIELGEIENVLLAQEGVREAVVLVREDNPDDKRLVAYLVGSADSDTLRQHLGQRLPDYMVPAAFVIVDAMPLTPNGKIDRRALPAPDYSDAQTEFIAPRNALEAQLAAMWSAMLGVDRVGVYNNFFLLGGHSLLVIQLIDQLRDELQIDLPLNVLYKTQTINGLAEWIRQQTTT